MAGWQLKPYTQYFCVNVIHGSATMCQEPYYLRFSMMKKRKEIDPPLKSDMYESEIFFDFK